LIFADYPAIFAFSSSLNPPDPDCYRGGIGKRKGKIQAAFYSRMFVGYGKARHHEKDQVLL
jgi:hypothetical protein